MVVPSSNPYPVDAEPRNTVVVPAGSYFWLKSRLFVGRINPATPDPDAFTRIEFVVLKDADGNTLSWGTELADPSDNTDLYSSASADYVGNLSQRIVTDGVTTNASPTITSSSAVFALVDAGKPVTGTGIPVGTTITTVVNATTVTLSQNATANGTGLSITIGVPNVGLYAENYPGTPSGRFAFKGLCPNLAEQTLGSSTRRYTVYWYIRKNGGIVIDSETFNVGPPGGIDFGNSITPAEFKAGYGTTLTDPEIEAAIAEATINVQVYIERAGCAVTSPPPAAVLQAILYESRLVGANKEATSGRLVNSVSQGGMSMSFQNVEAMLKRLTELVDKFVNAYLAMQCGIYGWKRPRVIVFRNAPGGSSVSVPRDAVWQFNRWW